MLVLTTTLYLQMHFHSFLVSGSDSSLVLTAVVSQFLESGSNYNLILTAVVSQVSGISV